MRAVRRRWWRSCYWFFVILVTLGPPWAASLDTISSLLVVEVEALESMAFRLQGLGLSTLAFSDSMITVSQSVLPASNASQAVCHSVQRVESDGSVAPATAHQTVCSAVGPSTGLSQAVLSVGKYAPGPYTIATYAVDAHELQQSLQVPISVDGRSTSYEVSPSFPTVSSAASLALASAFCSSQGITGVDSCGERLLAAMASQAEARLASWLSGRHTNRHALVLSNAAALSPAPELEDDVAVVINTNCRFFNTTTDRLLTSLLSGGWPAHLIFLASGGCPAPATWVHRGATVWEDEEDLIDFTAFHLLYARADLSGHHLPGRPSWWFYLHDTMEVGPSFRARLLDKASHVLRVQPQARAMALTWQASKSMNLGMYHAEHLLARRADFEQAILKRLQAEDKQARKRLGGDLEDLFLKPPNIVLTHVQLVQPEAVDVYGTGTSRRVLSYPELDCVKYQSNFFIPEGAEFNVDL